MLRTTDLDYELPADRIATHPADPRDSARLMVVERSGGSPPEVQHCIIRDLPDLLSPGDLLIFNTTRVLPARFRGRRVGTGGRIEGLYLHDQAGDEAGWVCLIKGRHTRAGAILELNDREGKPSGIRLIVRGRPEEEPEAWIVRIESPDPLDTREILERVGLTPLPPYILRARKDRGMGDDPEDARWYQTVYAHAGPAEAPVAGSVAAPTAGLHFTPELLQHLEKRGIQRADVTLHVGAGTFRPVETEFVEQHPMHAEWCSMSPEVLRQIREIRAAGSSRVIPVGTTAARTLEAYAQALESHSDKEDPPPWLETRLLITPGYRFRWCDGLLTNFHLPRSTLMALVAAMLKNEHGDGTAESSGLARLKQLYAEAVLRNYRFYSFGDAMLIL